MVSRGTLEKRQSQLNSRMPLIGRWVRRRAVAQLAKQAQVGSPDAARALAEAVARADDPGLGVAAAGALRGLTGSSCVDAVCEVWVGTRHEVLARLLDEAGWMARAPAQARVLTALKLGRLDAVADAGPAEVQWLLQACDDRDEAIARAAQQALRQLQDPAGRELLCRLAVEHGHPGALDAALAAGYAPLDPQQRAVFFFLTEQWERYETLDFDHSLLRAAYGTGNERQRRRIAERARQAGRVEWVDMAAGGRQGRRLAEMADAEWETALSVLSGREQWAELWRLAQEAPPKWSARVMHCLARAGWTPPAEGERPGFDELSRSAAGWEGDEIHLRVDALCQGTLSVGSIPVRHLAISPDGRVLVAGTWDGSIRILTFPEGKELESLEGHEGDIESLVISPDGMLVASGSRDSTIRLWQLGGGRELETLSGHPGPVRSLAISPDGRLLASGAQGDPAIRLWNLPGGWALDTLDSGSTGPHCLAITPDGKLLVAGGREGELQLWALPERRLLHRLDGHTDTVTCARIPRDGRLLATGSLDRTLRLWNLPEGGALSVLRGHADVITALAVTPDGRLLASGSKDGTVRLWNLPEGQALRVVEGHRGWVTALAADPSGRNLVSAGSDSVVRLWSLDPLRLNLLPAAQTTLEHLAWAEAALADDDLPVAQRRGLEYAVALMRWRRRFDIAVEDAPARFEAGEFDIEIEG
jgi:WD40 repeat protein